MKRSELASMRPYAESLFALGRKLAATAARMKTLSAMQDTLSDMDEDTADKIATIKISRGRGRAGIFEETYYTDDADKFVSTSIEIMNVQRDKLLREINDIIQELNSLATGSGQPGH